MRLLFTICGRAGSKGLRNKNLKNFMGLPLVYYTLAAVDLYTQKYNKNDTFHTCLSTDSEDLISIACQRKPDIYVVRRESRLCEDSVAKRDVIADCLKKSEVNFALRYDKVIDLDITSPLRTIEDIKAAIDKSSYDESLDIVFSVTPARRNPYFNMVKLEQDGSCSRVISSAYTARQQAPSIFDMNASIYVYNASNLRESQTPRCGFIEMRDTAVLDIDGEEDLELMQIIAEYMYQKYPAYAGIYYAAKTQSGG